MWAAFLSAHSATLGIVSFMALLASAFIIKTNGVAARPFHAIMVILAGQLAAVAVTPFAFGYLEWHGYFAPLVGVICGLLGRFALTTIIKIGLRVQSRSDDIADAGLGKIIPSRKEDP